MSSNRTLLLVATLTTSVLTGGASLSFGQVLRLDTQIENPPRNNNALELPEKKSGDTIQFQLFVPGAAGRQIQGYTVELALRGKTFGSYIDDVAGTDLTGSGLLSRVSGSGNPTLSMLSLNAVAIPANGYLGQIDLSVSRALTSSDALMVQSASTAGPGGVQNLDVSRASLSFTATAQCPGDFDGNGMVNLSDFLAFAGGFGTRSGDAGYDARMDMDGSGAVDLSDFLAFAGAFGTTCPPPPPPANSDRAALVALYNATDGANWRINTHWLSDRPLGEWYGVTVDASGRVIRLNLSGHWDRGKREAVRHGLKGPIPAELATLTGLTHLIFAFNELTSIAPELGRLANLTVLDLSANVLSGPIPPEIGRLGSLEVLRLGGNQLTCPIPPEIGNLGSLETLHLGGNQLTCAIPPEIGNLGSLERLLLNNNPLTGMLPPELGNLRSLKYIMISWTGVTGPIPPEIGNLASLESVWVQGARLTGPIPPEIGNLARLRSLDLYANQLTGPIPPEIGNLASLEWLGLSSNQLAGPIPMALGNLTNLSTLSLSNNSIADVSAVSSLTNLATLSLSNNNIADVSALSSLTNLSRLFLANNRISDLAPLVANNGLGTGAEVDVRGNPLSANSISEYVPALEARGVRIQFDENIVFTDPRIYNDNVFVLPVSEDLAAGNLPLDKYATRFYTYFSDAFDFLVFFPSLSRSQLDSDAFQGAFYASVGNDVQGIGKGTFFNDAWGSAGKLLGGLYFANVSVSGWEHSRLVQGPMLHELMHCWANFIVEPAVPHWDYTSANGILGGFNTVNLVEHGGGRYSAPNVYTGGWALNLKPYSPIELYLAGLMPPEQVPDLWVAEDGKIVKFGSGDAPDEFTASRVRTYTIEDVIAEHGARVPDYTRSQKAFRAAVILLVSDDYPAVRKSLEMLSSDANLFSHAGYDQFDDWYNFFEATGGRATISMDGLSRFKSTGASKRPAVRSFGTPPPPIVCHLEH